MKNLSRNLFNGEWENISNTTEAKNVIRLSCLYCKRLPFEPVEVYSIQPSEDLKPGDLKFARLVSASGNTHAYSELYGFYIIPNEGKKVHGNFFPVDENYDSIQLLRYMYSNEPIPQDKILPGFEIWFDEIKLHSNGRLVLSERQPVFLPFYHWEMVEKENGIQIYNQLESEFEQFTDTLGISIKQLWKCKLSFSDRYLLYEILSVKKDKHFCRSYFLVRWDEDEKQYIRAEAINGMSTVIHDIWGEIIDGRPGFFLSESNIVDYIRFFCWAIEADEGQFIQPVLFHEFPIRKFLPEMDEKLAPFKKEERTFIRFIQKEAKVFIVEALIIYGDSIFNATFNVPEENGLIEMKDDQPVANGFPFVVSKFNDEYLPVLEIRSVVNAQSTSVEPSNDSEDILFPLLNHLETYVEVNECDETIFREQVYDETIDFKFKNITSVLTRTHFTPLNTDGHNKDEVLISHCVFNKRIKFCGSLEIPTVIKFVNCVFGKGLDAREAIFSQSVIFENCIFYYFEANDTHTPVIDFHLLQSSGDILFRNCRILGQLVATNMHVSGNLAIEGTTIARSPVSKQFSVYNTANITTDAIEEGSVNYNLAWELLQLDNTTIDGNLQLGLLRNATSSHTKAHLLDLVYTFFADDPEKQKYYNEKIAAIHLPVTFIYGAVSAIGIHATNNVDFAGLITHSYAYFQNSNFGGDVTFRRYENSLENVVGFKSINGNLYFFNCTINGLLDLSNTDVHGDIELYSCNVNNYLAFENATCSGNICADHIRVLNYISFRHSSCKKLSIYKAIVEGYIMLSYFKSSEDIDMRFLEVKGMVAASQENNKNNIITRELLEANSIDLSGAKISGLRFEGIKVGGIIKVKTGTFGFVYIRYGLGPNNNLSEKVKFPLALTRSRCHGLIFDSVFVEGDMDLSGLYTTQEQSPNSKRLNPDIGKYGCVIRHTTIKGNLKLFSADNNHLVNEDNIELINFKVESEGKNYWWRDVTPDDCSIFSHSVLIKACDIAGSLDLRNIKVSGDIDITDTKVNLDIEIGADYERSDTSGKISGQLPLETRCHELRMLGVLANGHIDFTGLKASKIDASGSIIYRQWIFISKEHEALRAVITEELNLTDTEGEEIILSGTNMTKPKQLAILERAKFNKLIIYNPLPCFNLSGAVIGKWEFKGPFNRNSIENYIDILDRVNPFDKSVYLNVERMLNNEGDSNGAEKIHRAMHRKERKEIKCIPKNYYRWFKKLVGELYGYGTKLELLLVYWFLLVVLSTCVIYNNPNQFETNTSKAENHRIKETALQEVNFSTSTAGYIALMRCTPVVNLSENDKYVLKENSRLSLYFYLMTVFSYVLLVGAFIGVSKKISHNK